MNRLQAPGRFIGATHGGGFTLIELMIVITIIAILAAIALPSYNAYIIRSNRAAAKSCLSQLANYMERYYATNLRYDRDTSGTAFTTPQFDCMVQTSSSYTYTPTVTGTFQTVTGTMTGSVPSQTTYVFAAVPQGAQTRDTQCGTLVINQTGAQGISGSGDNVQTCWQR